MQIFPNTRQQQRAIEKFALKYKNYAIYVQNLHLIYEIAIVALPKKQTSTLKTESRFLR